MHLMMQVEHFLVETSLHWMMRVEHFLVLALLTYCLFYTDFLVVKYSVGHTLLVQAWHCLLDTTSHTSYNSILTCCKA